MLPILAMPHPASTRLAVRRCGQEFAAAMEGNTSLVRLTIDVRSASPAGEGRADLRAVPLADFKARVAAVASVPTLVLMVAFDAPLALPDSISFAGGFGSLGFAARDRAAFRRPAAR